MPTLLLALPLLLAAPPARAEGAGCSSVPQPCQEPGRKFCESDPAPGQCQGPPPTHCPPCSAGPPKGAPAPKTYLALDSRNIQDAGGAELVLGPVTKTHSALITEQQPWEMRFDNMQCDARARPPPPTHTPPPAGATLCAFDPPPGVGCLIGAPARSGRTCGTTTSPSPRPSGARGIQPSPPATAGNHRN